MDKIIRNKIRCRQCGDVIESTAEKLYVKCSCGCCAVDGGTEKMRRFFKNSPNDYEELSELILPELEEK